MRKYNFIVTDRYTGSPYKINNNILHAKNEIEVDSIKNVCRMKVKHQSKNITKICFFDIDCLFLIAQYRWCLKLPNKTNRCYYIHSKNSSLHSLINNTPKGFCTDHKNRNTLDNTQKNLRTCTYRQNQRNRRVQSNNKQGHKGINYVNKGKEGYKWRAMLIIGYFDTMDEAVEAYESATKKIFPEYSYKIVKLN